MPAKSKKYLITTESYEIIIVRQNSVKNNRGFCSECEKEVELLTLDEITSQIGKRTREIFEIVEKGLVHSFETKTGHLLICLDSFRQLNKKNQQISP